MFFVDKGKTSRSHEIDEKRLHKELGSSDRTGKPVKSEDIHVMHAHDGTGEPVKSSASTHTVERICSCRTSEELGDKQLFLKYQCSTDISFLLLILLPSILSNDRQTKFLFVSDDSEDNS